ncbi:hypothetical protein SAMN04488561_0432 [Jiangella alba]|uniref:Uncharacterized protein n=1 Tax=Jiangella alba TaxID=561176 RepID=A0A1H5DK30_9ACTN|nr:hypothetical protein SAMN04488561_0432 [Jiangella alba]
MNGQLSGTSCPDGALGRGRAAASGSVWAMTMGGAAATRRRPGPYRGAAGTRERDVASIARTMTRTASSATTPGAEPRGVAKTPARIVATTTAMAAAQRVASRDTMAPSRDARPRDAGERRRADAAPRLRRRARAERRFVPAASGVTAGPPARAARRPAPGPSRRLVVASPWPGTALAAASAGSGAGPWLVPSPAAGPGPAAASEAGRGSGRGSPPVAGPGPAAASDAGRGSSPAPESPPSRRVMATRVSALGRAETTRRSIRADYGVSTGAEPEWRLAFHHPQVDITINLNLRVRV